MQNAVKSMSAPVEVPLWGPPQVPKPRLHMPFSSGISQWCASMGRRGIDYHPDVSIYNTGHHLFCVMRQPPYIRFTAEMQWLWIKFEDYNPSKQPDHLMRRLGRRCQYFDLLGHDPYHFMALCNITFRAALTESHFVAIKPGHFLHIVNGPSGVPRLALESRPLPLSFFTKALEQGKRVRIK